MKRVIALGFFDGVHRGHGKLLQLCRSRADALGCQAAALTFDHHPDQVIFGRETPLLSTIHDRIWMMKTLYGMDQVLVAHFDRAMMEKPWEDFVRNDLIRDQGACHLVCGHDFTFGYRGQGNPQKLRALCAELGVGCDIVDKVMEGDKIISSTLIRSLIREGNLESATKLLGHPHFLSGTVIPGKKLGRTLGIPTANLAVPGELLVPAHGVYASMVQLPDGSRRMAVTNVGTCPTVGKQEALRVEPWILDFDGDLYGRTIWVQLYRRLRPERKFASLEALKAEVLRNADQTRKYFVERSGRI